MFGDTPLGRRSNSTSRSSKPVPWSALSFSLGPRPTFRLLVPVKSSPKMPYPDSGERQLSVFWQPPEVRLLSLAGADCGGRVDRVRFVTHQGKQILFIDMTNCVSKEV